MPFIDPTQTITITRGDGVVIANGSASAVFRHVKDSRINRDAATLTAEAAIAEANAKARLREVEARADALDARENAIATREKKAFSDQIRAFANSVSALASRFDAFVQVHQDAELAKLPDPDNPRQADDLEAPIEPSAPRHQERLEAMEAVDTGERELAEAEDVLDDELQLRHEEPADGDPGQVLPSTLEPTVGRFEGGRLPENTMFPVNDGYGRIRKRWEKRKLRG
jgi:hypothetical protein